MAKYLLIESRDPFDSNEVPKHYDVASGLVAEGNEVTLFLVQNGVLPARRGARSDGLADAAAAGVEILADEFSLRERAIPADGLIAGVGAAPLDVVIDAMAAGSKTIWH